MSSGIFLVKFFLPIQDINLLIFAPRMADAGHIVSFKVEFKNRNLDLGGGVDSIQLNIQSPFNAENSAPPPP